MEHSGGHYAMPLPKKSTTLSLDEFRLALDSGISKK
jgi:hypothetical protein